MKSNGGLPGRKRVRPPITRGLRIRAMPSCSALPNRQAANIVGHCVGQNCLVIIVVMTVALATLLLMDCFIVWLLSLVLLITGLIVALLMEYRHYSCDIAFS